jgi:predicted amidophosphoribosyltransferase
MIKIDPKEIDGSWDAGWALDLHTLSSVPLGPDSWGREQFDTERTELGKAVFLLKYRDDQSQLDSVAETAAGFLRSLEFAKNVPIQQFVSAIIPVPPSQDRLFQPVPQLAARIGRALGMPVPLDYLLKTRSRTAQKNMTDTNQRRAELAGAFSVADDRFATKRLILFDDVFRSGDTMNSISDTLKKQGKVTGVYVLALTRTRSRR